MALGIALSRGVPMIGWNSLAGISAAPLRYAVVGDARRQQWHFTEMAGGEMIAGPTVGDAEAVAAKCAAYEGPLFTLDAQSPLFCAARCAVPEAAVLAARAASLAPGVFAARATPLAEPIYLSAPFITAPRVRA